MCDLQTLFGEVAVGLPSDVHASQAVLDAATIPRLPRTLTTERIVIRRSNHDYNGHWRAEALQVYATPGTLRTLGVAVFAALFSPLDTVTDITLTHGATSIRTLRLRTPGQSTTLTVAAMQYSYFPGEVTKHPFVSTGLVPDDLPTLFLTDRDEIGGITDADWQARDTVVGFGNLTGMSEMGQLLLDMGRAEPLCDEYHLEGEMGFRGVGRGSAEVSFWLPGSFGWEPDYGLE